MEEQAFQNLQQTIFKLRKEREEVAKDLLLDKKNLNDLETNMRKVKMELEYRKSTLREKEQNVSEYEKMISDSEKTYYKIIETSNKLASALEQESNYIKSKLNK